MECSFSFVFVTDEINALLFINVLFWDDKLCIFSLPLVFWLRWIYQITGYTYSGFVTLDNRDVNKIFVEFRFQLW
jgi:hypothetical protein